MLGLNQDINLDINKFDVKKFLSLPLNDGSLYWGTALDWQETCGCIKGIFTAACGLTDVQEINNAAGGLIGWRKDKAVKLPNGQTVLTWRERFREIIVAFSAPNYANHGLRADAWANSNPRLQLILDRGEERLLQGRPQYAKLLVIRALRFYGYIPQDAEVTAAIKELTPA